MAAGNIRLQTMFYAYYTQFGRLTTSSIIYL